MNNSRNNDIHTPESIHLENNFSENIIARDRTRSEEPWSTEGEHLMKDWMKQIFNLQSRHDEAGYYYKKMRKIWGLPCILIPSIMIIHLNVYSKWKFIQYINMGAFVLVAIILVWILLVLHYEEKDILLNQHDTKYILKCK